MKNLIGTIILMCLTSIASATDEDTINANMMWDDNSDFHNINKDVDCINANMMWDDDEDFQRINAE